jgi:opacity protein-like surface antigen
MKLLTATSIVSLATLFAVSAANAADVYGRDTPHDAYQDAPVRMNWSGLYVGGAIGHGQADHDLSVRDFFKDFCDTNDSHLNADFDPFKDDDRPWLDDDLLVGNGVLDCDNTAGDFDWNADNGTVIPGDSQKTASFDADASGLVGDVRLGYDQQAGRFLFGVFGTYGFSDVSKDVNQDILDVDGNVLATLDDIERGEDWSIGGRAGFLMNERALLYILAAYTQTDYTFGGLGDNGSDKDITFSGVTVGGGIEFAVAENVFLGVEGTHTFYDDETVFSAYDEADNIGTSVSDDLSETRIMGTLKIKLNNGVFGN